MNLQQTLAYLQGKNVLMSVQHDQLRVRAPEGVIDATIANLLRTHKQELIAVLQREQRPDFMDQAAAPAPARITQITRITPDMLPLVALSQEEIDRIVAQVPDGAANVQDIYPLAPLQEGILFHHLLDGAGDAYLLRSVMAFDSRERLDAFLAALQTVIDRHDVLRSAMRWEALREPVQVVQRRARLPVEPFTSAGADALVDQLLAATDPQTIRLDLRQAPLMAAHTAFDPASDEWLLSLLYHHIVCDHVTLDLILGEIDAILRGRGGVLPPALPYRDFVAQARSVAPAEHEAYFRRQLGDLDTPSAPFGLLDVQGDGARLTQATLSLPPELALRIRDCARERGVTPAVLFHVGWALVVGQCSGRDDVVFGTVVSGRLQGSAGADQVMGMFINTLPIRVSLAGRSAGELVTETYQRLSELLVHEQASLALAQRCSDVPASLPLFTALFNYRHGSDGGAAADVDAAPAWAGMRMLADEERTNYPLGISVDDLGRDFSFTAQCVDAIAPARLTSYLCTAMEWLVEALRGDASATAAPSILSQRERQQLLVDFNATETALPPHRFAHQLFEAHAALSPEATALVFDDDRLTYAALNRRANQVAHHLLGLGVRPGGRVAICAERGIEMVTAVLAVLKAGAAYVPLDPAYPADRLAYMLTDSEPTVLLTQQRLAARMPTLSIPVVALDTCAASIDAQPANNPDPELLGLAPRHLAYLIYTSGSTGAPKAVMVPHSGLVNLAATQIDGFGVTPDSRILQFVSFAFDVCVSEMTMALCSGAALYLATRDALLPGPALLATCRKHGITHLSLPVPALAALPQDAELGALGTIIVGGDACPPALAAHWAARVRLFNAYGPTETTVCATTYRCQAGSAASSPVPIGRPVANARIYVLDAQLRPVPLGVTGEIHIGGAGVAQGYWKRPDLTAERFIADPFSSEPGARLYKTGDLGRWRADGTLDYQGRNDFQLKIRGFRIEPGEIEARLAACPGVHEAVVLAHKEATGEQRLVAYYSGADAPGATALRAQLAAQLPDHMVPAAFVNIARWPLTPNGKLDRKALPKPGDDAYAGRAYEAPCGPTEMRMAQLWQELLGVERIGRHDNFFELGGHSLLAVRLVGRLRQALGRDIAVRELFAAPTLAAFARAAGRSASASLAPITPVERSGALPLSAMQQRLWLLDRLDPNTGAAYHMPARLRLVGQLDLAALRAALDHLLARHESLRTTFAMRDGQPSQVIGPASAGFALRVEDVRGMQPLLREELTERALRAPFDLASGPLIRGQLLQLADDEYELLIVQHHIVSDGWSIGVMIAEFNALYSAFAQGETSPLAALPIQYADYAVWQQRQLQGARRQELIDFWRDHLDAAPALLALPTDRPRPPSQSHAGALFEFGLDAGLSARLHRLSQQHGCTMFMTLLAAWASLMARMAGQDDVVIGTPVANRQHAEVEGLIGFFVNTLALQVRFEPDLSVAGLLEQVKASTLAAYAHQDLPFEQVVDALQPARSAGHSPLFQVMLAWDNTPAKADVTLPGLSVSPLPLPHTSTQFDLSLSLSEGSEGIVGSLEYASDLFDEASVARLAASFRRLLGAMAEDADKAVAALPLLDAAARRQILVGFNDTVRDFPQGQLIHQLLETRAASRPHAPAVCDEARELSFDALNRRANQLAHALLALGVQPDDRVALCLERGVEMIVAVLGILKAGAAYVPLDPGYPVERLRFMLDDSAPVALLTQASLLPSLPELTAPVIDLDSLSFEAYNHNNPDPRALGLDERHLAYVIYTSGSTGRPKGVMVEHRSVCNLAYAQIELFGVSGDSRVLQFASCSFDASVWEMVMALCAGAALHMAGKDALRAGPALLATIEERRITHVTLPSSAVAAWGEPDAFPALTLIVAGEACPPELARQWAGRVNFVNAYGPTEATVCATSYRCSADPGFSVPIGRPIANARIYVLDDRLEPVPIGVEGDLYIGGKGLARGYLNRPDLTAASFIDNPFDGAGKIYKSGDRARWLADGNLDYLGRADFQVKLRGFRIEPGEIEAKLMQCAGVRQAVVMVRENGPGDQRLVAYLTAHEQADLSLADVRAQLGTALPDYMLPQALVILDALPLTANGKLDRQALPVPGVDAYQSREYEAPRAGSEQTLALIWGDLLGRERIGRADNFFELGGHSLLAVTLIERLRAAGWTADVRTLFLSPTLAGLAATLRRAPMPGTPANLIAPSCERITPELLPLVSLTQTAIDRIVATVPGGAANIQDIYPLAPLQEGILFHHLMHSQGDTYLLSQLFAFDTCARVEQFLQALRAVIKRHDILRTAIVWDGLPQAVQVVWREAPLAVEEVIVEHGDVMEHMRTRFDSRHMRLDLDRAPLIQAHFAHDHANERVLLALVCHHLVADHTTLALMVDEVRAHLDGKQAQLPAPLPFRNLIAHTRMGVTQDEHTDFFRRMLADIDAPTAPFGLLDVQTDGAVIDQASLPVEAALAARIRACARTRAVSTASIFHLAWAMVLARLTGRSELVFGTVLFGRMQGGEGADRALGLFINTLPLRLSVSGRDIAQSLQDTQHALSELLHHEHASLALAQRCSAVSAPAPLFTSLLNYRHSPAGPQAGEEEEAAWPGMELLHGEERTNYPVAMSVDDLGNAFTLAAQVQGVQEAERLCAYLHAALAGLIRALETAPGTCAKDIDILPRDEQRKLLAEWNPAVMEETLRERCIHHLFEEQAARTPDATALVQDRSRMSYAELNARANQLAHYLVERGVRPDARVAISVARGMPLIVGLLAILKAGAAYVPLDPAYPVERLRFMLEDSAPLILLNHGVDPRKWGELPGALALIDMDRDRLAWHARPGTNLDAARLGLSPRNLAYLMYTSGSTGQPKGVMIEHRSLSMLALAQIAGFGVEADSRVLQFASASFDACISEVMMTLCRGAALVLPAPGGILAGDALVDIVDRHGITHATLPPAVLDALPETATLASIRTMIVAGEAPSSALVRRWGRERRLINAYGPTETTVCASQYDCRTDEAGQPPIGRPLPHVRIYILDADLRPTPIGVAGDIHIGGAGVARGYHARAALTDERFVLDPFCAPGHGHERMYRTGDLGRFRADGNIEFLGRNDGQLKLRGYRIETGEIEARLCQLEGISAAVAALREDAPGGKRLVAYYVAERAFPSEALRSHLADALPEHMVPSAFIELDALPLTLNGKIDHAALPALDSAGEGCAPVEPASTELEQTLARIWGELLNIDQPGRHDHFFERGGHSLLAVQLLSQLRQAGIDVSISTLFNHPTIARLAAHITGSKLKLANYVLANRGSDSSRAVPFRAHEDACPLFLVHEVSGELFYAHVLTAHIAPGTAVYGLPGLDKAAAPHASIEEAARRLIGMIKQVQPSGPYRVAGWSFGGILAYEIAAQLLAAGEKVDFLGLFDTAYAAKDEPDCAPDAALDPPRRDDKDALLELFVEPADIDAYAREQLHARAASLDFATLARELQTLELIPKRMGPQDIQRWVRHWNGNVQAMESYRVPSLDLDLTLFVAQEQVRDGLSSPMLGWERLLPAERLTVVAVPGNHQTMMEAPHCQVLGAALSHRLHQLPRLQHLQLQSHSPLLASST